MMDAVWYVRGADPDVSVPVLFDTKLGAEIYARMQFPDESPSQRYARVFYREVWREEDLK